MTLKKPSRALGFELLSGQWGLATRVTAADLDCVDCGDCRYDLDLAAADRKHIARLPAGTIRRRYLAGRRLLRDELAEHMSTDSGRLSFLVESAGKPVAMLDGQRVPLAFNAAHADNIHVTAISHSRAVGVDIEFATVGYDVLEVAETHFRESEVCYLGSLPTTKRDRVFLRIWTLKEAALKALGTGLSYGLKNLVVVFDGAGVPSVKFDQPWDGSCREARAFTHDVAVGGRPAIVSVVHIS